MAGFSLDVSNWIAKAGKRADLVLRKVALDLFTRVIMRSPVDTGRFRGNWQVAIGSVPDGVLDLDDKSGTATISAASATAAGVKAGEIIYLVNNLPYGPSLERGHSQQAPTGMVGITVAEFQAAVGSAAASVRGGAR
jgi:hypothetical protein